MFSEKVHVVNHPLLAHKLTILRDKDIYIRFDVVDEHGCRANTCAYYIDEL